MQVRSKLAGDRRRPLQSSGSTMTATILRSPPRGGGKSRRDRRIDVRGLAAKKTNPTNAAPPVQRGVPPPRPSTVRKSSQNRHATSLAFRRRWRPAVPCPRLKNGTCLAGTSTTSPVRGLRPARAGRERTENAPKPRSSTRPPLSSASNHAPEDHAPPPVRHRAASDAGFPPPTAAISSDLIMPAPLVAMPWPQRADQ